MEIEVSVVTTHFLHSQALISNEHYASAKIQSQLTSLAEEHGRLLDTWKKRQDLFNQCYELQVFLRDAEQRDAWISTQEAFLSTEDLGVSSDDNHCVDLWFVPPSQYVRYPGLPMTQFCTSDIAELCLHDYLRNCCNFL